MASPLHRILLLFSFLIALTAASGPAFAHAALNGSYPADGSVLPVAPDTLTLSFSEPVSPLALRLIGPDGQATALDRFLLKDRTVVIEAPGGLARGTHVLSWRVVSEDGHPVGGSVLFSIGAPGGQPKAVADQSDPLVRTLVLASRLALYLALFLGCGGAASTAWVGPLSGRARTTVTGVTLLGLLSLPVALGAQGLDALGADVGALLQAPVWKAAIATSYAFTIAIAASALFAALIALRLAGRAGALAGLVSLALAGLALAASGHASAAPPQGLMRPMVFLHATAIAAWSGALLPLAVALRGPGGSAALRRFSTGIVAVVAALLASGLVLAIVQVEQPSALLDTAYGRVLLAKLALVGFAFALAGLNRWRLTSRVRAGSLIAARTMARVIFVELAVLVAVFGTAALWRFTPPPRALAVAAAQPASVHIHTLKAMADVTVTPGRAGGVVVTVTLLNGEFGPLPAKELNLTFANPTAGIEPIERAARLGSDGAWRVEGLVLPVPGRWNAELEILVSDFEMLRLAETIEIRP